MKTRSIISLVAAGALVAGLAACTAGTDTGTGGDAGLIGVAMPTKSSERWIADGNALKDTLEGQGFTVDLQYAEDDIPTQVSQVENMITKGAKVLIIAAIDGTTLTSVLQEAADNEIPVIAYDRLIRDSENVNYYATFDNFLVGQQQAWTLLNGLGLTELDGTPIADAPAGPFNIELFAGSLDDNNAFFFFNGAMDVLQPLIDDGTLVVKSGQTDIEQAATLRWDGEVAQSRMEDLLTANYSDGSKVNAVLSPVRRPFAWNHLRADRRRLHGGRRTGRSSPARTPRSTRSRQSCRASSTRPSSRTPASWPRLLQAWLRPC